MLFTTHAITGAAAGVATGNPYAALPVGWLLHHTLDAIPHFDQGSFYTKKTSVRYLGIDGDRAIRFTFSRRDWIMLFIDWGVAGAVYLLLLYTVPLWLWPQMLMGTLGSLLPDIVDASPLWSKKLREKVAAARTYHAFHIFFHWTVPPRVIWLGVLTQLIAISGSLVYLL